MSGAAGGPYRAPLRCPRCGRENYDGRAWRHIRVLLDCGDYLLIRCACRWEHPAPLVDARPRIDGGGAP